VNNLSSFYRLIRDGKLFERQNELVFIDLILTLPAFD